MRILRGIFYSFPIQLLLNNFKRNHILMLCWIIVFAMVTGSFGKYLGIPYLFLDPEYLNRVDFKSFFIMGTVTAGFGIAFHITTYITEGHRFSFVGTLPRPFTQYSLNNSILPLVFLAIYVNEIISFQINNRYSNPVELTNTLGGFFAGYIVMTAILFLYFWLTNKDIFRYVVCRIDEKLKQNVQVTRASALKKLDIARKRQIRVDYYIDYRLRIRKVEEDTFYDKTTVLQVFDQNHLNLVIIELLILAFVLVLGIFKDVPAMQLPAASSFVILLTIFVMLAGAFSYWFGEWSTTMALVIFLFINYLVGEGAFSKRYEAFGLNYNKPPVDYSVETLGQESDSTDIAQDKARVITALDNWRAKFPADQDPRMVFLCVSGGGKRAALWAFTSLQTADSLTDGALMKNSMLITGASGGLIGASYYRELVLRSLEGRQVDPYSSQHRINISNDNLNPLIFSLLANDLFVGFTQFNYGGQSYVKDRGYTFELQLNRITESFMDKPIKDYAAPEQAGIIPMVILSPTIVNDGRRLYIASQPVSFMNSDIETFPGYRNSKVSGVDFQRMFRDYGGENLRFLSALRMSATFPYITPNTSLPTKPVIQMMDAGISDNFGINDAMRFVYAFKDWITAHTKGIIILSIRDSPKLGTIPPNSGQTIVDDFTQPIASVYNNFENFQDINSDLVVSEAQGWLGKPIERVDLEYEAEQFVPILQKMDSIRQTSARASLSWRLTSREKQSIISTIGSPDNQRAIMRLKALLK